MEKKRWKKPKLVVLLRGRPEEAVLTACKNALTNGLGATRARCGRGNCGVPCSTVVTTS